MKTQTNIIRGPVTDGIGEYRTKKSDCCGEDTGAIRWWEQIEHSIAEGVEPDLHTSGERRGAGYEVDGLNFEAGLLEERAIVCGRGEEGGGCFFGINAVRRKGGLECCAYSGDVALAAHLGDKATVGLERAADALEDRCGVADPVERGI